MDAAPHWRTLLPPEYTARFGCSALHTAMFEHTDDPGGAQLYIGNEVPEFARLRCKDAMREAGRHRARIGVVAEGPAQVPPAGAGIDRRRPRHPRGGCDRAEPAGFGG